MKTHNEHEKIAKIGLIKLEHIYYKKDSLYELTRKKLEKTPEKLEDLYLPDEPTEDMINKLVALVIKNCTSRMKVKALLLQCFHHAIHNRFYEAKDLLMKARVPSLIHKQ